MILKGRCPDSDSAEACAPLVCFLSCASFLIANKYPAIICECNNLGRKSFALAAATDCQPFNEMKCTVFITPLKSRVRRSGGSAHP